MTTILVIEDDRSVQEMLYDVLTEHGYDALTADTGPEGLVLLAHESVDLVLLDLSLPRMDGIAVARKIREGAQARVPIIILTANHHPDNVIEGIRLRVTDYVTKPFDPFELVDRIKAALSQSRRAP